MWSVKGEKNPQKSHSLFDKEKLVVEQDRKNVTRLIDLPKKKKKSKKGAKQQEEETIQSHFWILIKEWHCPCAGIQVKFTFRINEFYPEHQTKLPLYWSEINIQGIS